MLLQRAALAARVARHRAPDPLAGLKVDDGDVANLLAELPGLERSDDSSLADIEDALAGHVTEARAAFEEGAGPDTPFGRLVAAAQLTPIEAEVLAVLCAVEVDPRRQRLVGYLNDDVTQRRLTPWTLAQLFDRLDGAVAAAGPGGGLRRAALIGAGGDEPWAIAPLTVSSTVVWWLQGDQALDPDLPDGAEDLAGPGTGKGRMVVAAGPDRRRRLHAASTAMSQTRLLVTAVPANSAQWDAVIRQATLWGSGVILEADGSFGPEARDRVERAHHLAWAVLSANDLPLSDLPRAGWTEVAVGDHRATDEEWTQTFGPQVPRWYALSADQLHQVGRAAEALDGDIAAAVRRLAAGHIDNTATRIRPSRTWDDLILDEQRTGQLRQIALRGRHRDTVYGTWAFPARPSTGTVALFAGPSGTGKTLAAEIIAADLGVDLYKIDLANLVSKYIGETEKNLGRLFDAAEASNVALLLDEADALLGKRSDVSDAHDRYANIEVAYLLQRLERYEGVAILATNLAKNIDPAFIRRLHVLVEFPLPGPAERRRIWA
jgi:hypothetical protein